MKRLIVGELEARQLLLPYYEKLVDIQQKSFTTVNNVQNYLNGSLDFYPEIYSLTKAILTWNLTVNFAKQAFENNPNIKYVGHTYNSHWFNFSDLLYLRFKKLDDELKPFNSRTGRIILKDKQESIPGFPDKPTLVEAGYTTNATMTEIKQFFIVCWSNQEKIWEIDLLNATGRQISIFNTDKEAGENIEQLLKIRENFKIRKPLKNGSTS